MIATISPKEDKLILASRLLDESQLEILVDIVHFLVEKKQKKTSTIEDKKEFLRTLENIRDKAQQQGLTPEILEKILAEDE